MRPFSVRGNTKTDREGCNWNKKFELLSMAKFQIGRVLIRVGLVVSELCVYVLIHLISYVWSLEYE